MTCIRPSAIKTIPIIITIAPMMRFSHNKAPKLTFFRKRLNSREKKNQ